MHHKIVSVIVPVYNVEKYLDRCVESIVSQTYKNLEIILIDDGSPDNCPKMCDDWAKKDSRIKVIHKENGGVSSARNCGLDEAKGEYISFVDSDDWIEDSHIEKMVSYINDTDCVIAGYTKENTTGKINCSLSFVNVDLAKIDKTPIGEVFWNGYIHPCWNKLFKKETLKKSSIQFQEEIHLSEDSLFCIQYLKCCKKMAVTDETTYHYWIDEQCLSLSKKIYPDIFDICSKVYYLLNDLLEQGHCNSDFKYEILTRTIYPQIYNAVLKILLNTSMSKKEKRHLLETMEKNACCKNVLIQAEKMLDNKIEKFTLKLLLNRKYLLLEGMWNCLKKKSR